MPFAATAVRRWVVRLAGVLVLGVSVWTLSPRLFSAGDDEKLRPELALVPSDAFVFVHIRLGEVWGNEMIVSARKLVEEITHHKDFSPINPADVESASFVLLSGETLSLLEQFGQSSSKKPGSKYDKYPSKSGDKYDKYEKKTDKYDKYDKPKFDDKKPDFKDPPKKDPEKTLEKFNDRSKDIEKPKPSEEKNKLNEVSFQPAPGGKQPFQPKTASNGFDGIQIVTMRKPYDRAQITEMTMGDGAKELKHNGKTYLRSAVGNYLHFATDTIFVMATSEKAVKMALERPLQAQAEGPQAAALKLAMTKKHHLVVGLNLGDPVYVEMKNRLAKQLKQPEDYLDLQYPTAPVWTLLPLLETQTATLTVDLAKENKVQVQANFVYPDSEKAVEALGAWQDSLVMGRVFMIERVINRLAYEAGQVEDHRQDVIFVSMLLKQAQAAVREATAERRQSTVRLQIEGQFDLDTLRSKAKTAAANYVADPVQIKAASRKQIVNNLRQMTLAMHAFHDSYKTLPPPAICGKDGTPLLSWRVAVLPYIEQLPLYEEFKLNEPWDSPDNIKLLPRMPKIYAPLGVTTKEKFATNYQVFVGEHTGFPVRLDKETPFGARGCTLFRDITDGTSNTIGIVVTRDLVPWSKPADLKYDAKMPLPKLGNATFPDGFYCSLLDGSVRFVSHAVSQNTLRNAITRDDGNPPGSDW